MFGSGTRARRGTCCSATGSASPRSHRYAIDPPTSFAWNRTQSKFRPIVADLQGRTRMLRHRLTRRHLRLGPYPPARADSMPYHPEGPAIRRRSRQPDRPQRAGCAGSGRPPRPMAIGRGGSRRCRPATGLVPASPVRAGVQWDCTPGQGFFPRPARGGRRTGRGGRRAGRQDTGLLDGIFWIP